MYPRQKREIRLVVYSRSNLTGVKYIHLSLARSLTQSVTHSLTHPLTHSPTHPLTHSPTHPPTHPRTHLIWYMYLSLKFWNSFWLEIIIVQAYIFIQTQKTTEANFTLPPGHRTSIVTCSRAKFTQWADVLTRFWNLLWSMSEQMHCNI